MPSRNVISLIVFFVLVIAMLGLRVSFLDKVVESRDATIEAKQAELATARLSIETVTRTNARLTSTIGLLNQRIKDEQQAALAQKQFNATAVANMNTALEGVKELLSDDEDTCGKRLPGPVTDRMWKHYRPEGGDANRNSVHVSSSG